MALFASAKELEESKAQVLKLTSDLSSAQEKIAALEKAAGEFDAKLEAAHKETLTLKAEAERANGELEAKLKAANESLAAEKKAHEDTKAGVSNVASVKAQQILAEVGHAPIKVSTSDNPANPNADNKQLTGRARFDAAFKVSSN
jgi:chromosome segregation ATPase